MSLSYDQNIFNKYRALAITEVSDIEVGETYYSNCWPREFIPYSVRRRKETVWIRFDLNPDSFFSYISARDRNIGASYNPWLIFKDKETRDRCIEELKIVAIRDGYGLCDDY